MNPCEAVRESAAWVVDAGSHVRIDDRAIDQAVAAMDDATLQRFYTPQGFDREIHLWAEDNPELVIQYLLVVDTLNFCFWPKQGLEYEQLSTGVKQAAQRDPTAISAHSLQHITEDQVNSFLTDIDTFPNVNERVRLLREVGNSLLTSFDGKAINLVRAAKNSSLKLLSLITAHFPGFRDHAIYKGRQVFFYKRAQIFVADVYGAFQGKGLGSFTDIKQLTMFADYRVPVVLREMGIIHYSPSIAAQVDEKQEIEPGSEEEIEIRSATVVAVERFKAAVQRRTNSSKEPPLSLAIDWYLWDIGERNIDSYKPHHRTNTIYY